MVATILWASVNWWADIVCLVCVVHAAGVHGLSFAGALLVWAAGVGAASFSPTPAGIGAVEVVMATAFAALHVHGSGVVCAILVYRVISLKLLGTGWAYLYRRMRRTRRTRAHTTGNFAQVPGRPPSLER